MPPSESICIFITMLTLITPPNLAKLENENTFARYLKKGLNFPSLYILTEK